MMDENGVEEVGQLGGSGGTIQLALDALKEKKGSVDQVKILLISPLPFPAFFVRGRFSDSPSP